MFKTCRVAHIRYRNGETVHKTLSDQMDRVVTVVWNYYPKKNMLTYGATVYKKSDPTDRWSKHDHYDQAKQRFDLAPIMVNFNSIEPFSKKAMDKYIADKLIYFYGCFSTVLDQTHHITKHIDINPQYDPYFKLFIKLNEDEMEIERSCSIMELIGAAHLVGIGAAGLVGLVNIIW